MWSLGVVLYAMITGKWPFHGENNNAVRSAIKKGEPSFKSWTDVKILFFKNY